MSLPQDRGGLLLIKSLDQHSRKLTNLIHSPNVRSVLLGQKFPNTDSRYLVTDVIRISTEFTPTVLRLRSGVR